MQAIVWCDVRMDRGAAHRRVRPHSDRLQSLVLAELLGSRSGVAGRDTPRPAAANRHIGSKRVCQLSTLHREGQEGKVVDEPRSHWGRGWKVFLGIGALLGVLFAFGDLPSKLRDACNGWGIDVCRDRYAVETYLSDSPHRAPSARPERMDILGVRVGTVADDVRAMFPPGVKVTAGEASEGKALNAWQWEGVTFAAQVDIATGSLELPFSVAVAEDSKWLVAVPDGILLGKTTLKQAEQVHASRGSAPELYDAWFEGLELLLASKRLLGQ